MKGPAGCGGTAIKAGLLEEYVTGAVLDALESPRVQQALRQGEDQDAPRRADLLAQIQDARERREEARRDYAGRVIDRADWLDIRQRTEDEIGAARREYDRLAGSAPVMGDIPPSERVRDAWESWSTDRRRAAIRAVLVRVLIKPLPAGASANVAGNSKNTALRRERELAVLRLRLARLVITPARAAAEASPSCRWSGRAASCFGARRRAGITQERGEHRDRCRVLNALRETLPGPGAARIVRAGLPDRGAFLVAERLPCAVTGRARPVRPAPPPGSARHGPARARGPGRDHPRGGHSHRPPPGPAHTPASPADPDRAARAGVPPPVPVKPGARPPGHAHQSGDVRPVTGGLAERRHGAVPVSPVRAQVPASRQAAIGRGRIRPARRIDDAAGGLIGPGPVMGIVRGSSGAGLAGQAGGCPFRSVVAWSHAAGRGFAGHGSASRPVCRPGGSSAERSARVGSGGAYAVSRPVAVP